MGVFIERDSVIGFIGIRVACVFCIHVVVVSTFSLQITKHKYYFTNCKCEEEDL